MKYCENLTMSHMKSVDHPEILIPICDLLIKEGCLLNEVSPFHNNKSLVINGDELEAIRVLGTHEDKKKSVDLIFGIKSDDGIENIQLVEIKLNSQNTFYFLDKPSLREKVIRSSAALGTSAIIAKKYYLLFKKEHLELAIRYLFRINPRLNNDFKAIDVVGLHQKFFLVTK